MNRSQRAVSASPVAIAVAAILGNSAAGLAHAEDAPLPGSLQLEEVLVTATKRSESLQSVPVSVTALTAGVLERGNTRELGDLVKLSPGLTISYGSQPGNFAISMRGIGTFSNGIAVESDVAVVVDDVPYGFQAAAFQDLIDVDRVEVLRGPQSTLFGKSAIAGVLNIVTAAPTHEWTGKASVLGTNDSEKRGSFTVSGPLSDTVRVRLTVSDSDYDGNVKNITTGRKINGSSGLTATGKIEWTPTDNLTFSLAPRFNRNESTCCASPLTSLTPGLFYQGEPGFPASTVLAGIPIGPGNHYIRNDTRPNGGDTKTTGATGRVDYHFDDSSFMKGHSFSSITSIDHWRMFDYQDIDGLDAPFLLGFPVSAPSGINSGAAIRGYFHEKSYTQEFRLTSPDDTRLRYVTGLWFARNDLDRYLGRGPVLQQASYLAKTSNENYAVFTNATYDLTEKFGLVAGLRFNKQKIDYTFDNYNVTPNAHFGGANQENSVTGKGGIQYKWTPDIMTFATYSTGYKGQAYDLVSTFNARVASHMPVPHETAKNYEVGLKSSLFDRRVYFDLTLFHSDFYGFQTSVTQTLPDGTFLTSLNSVGHLKTQGVEVDTAAKVTTNFQLNGSLAYTEATVAEFPNGPCYNNPSQTLAQGCYVDATNSRVQDLRGKPLNSVPKWKGNIGGEYDQPLGSLPFGAFATFAYRIQSKVNFSLSQDPRTIQGGYGIADFGVGINDNNGHYKVTAFIDNAFDKNYATSIGNGPAGFSAPGVIPLGTSWTPARDSFRYFGARIDVSF
jgi:iron complex outermembrane receptor protein